MPSVLAEQALLDTNILVFAMNEDTEHHVACRALRDKGLRGTLRLCIAPQVLFEYFAVVTNPGIMQVPLAAEDALADIEKLAATFPLIQPPHDLLKRIFALLRATGTSGRHIFDLELAATMIGNGVTTIYTYDGRFTKIPGITARTP